MEAIGKALSAITLEDSQSFLEHCGYHVMGQSLYEQALKGWQNFSNPQPRPPKPPVDPVRPVRQNYGRSGRPYYGVI